MAWRWHREGHGPLDGSGKDTGPWTAQGGDAVSLEGTGRGRRVPRRHGEGTQGPWKAWGGDAGP